MLGYWLLRKVLRTRQLINGAMFAPFLFVKKYFCGINIAKRLRPYCYFSSTEEEVYMNCLQKISVSTEGTVSFRMSDDAREKAKAIWDGLGRFKNMLKEISVVLEEDEVGFNWYWVFMWDAPGGFEYEEPFNFNASVRPTDSGKNFEEWSVGEVVAHFCSTNSPLRELMLKSIHESLVEFEERTLEDFALVAPELLVPTILPAPARDETYEVFYFLPRADVNFKQLFEMLKRHRCTPISVAAFDCLKDQDLWTGMDFFTLALNPEYYATSGKREVKVHAGGTERIFPVSDSDTYYNKFEKKTCLLVTKNT